MRSHRPGAREAWGVEVEAAGAGLRPWVWAEEEAGFSDNRLQVWAELEAVECDPR